MYSSLKALSSIFSSETGPSKRRSRKDYKNLRHYIYDLLHTVVIDTTAELYVKIFLAVIIALNVTAVIVESVPSIENEYRQYFYVFEIFTIVVFSLEYVLRVWSIVESERFKHPIIGRLKYVFSFYALIDLLSILPFYLPVLVGLDFRFLRGLRLLRLLRILKLGGYSDSLSLLSKVAKRKVYDIAVSLTLIFLLIILSACMLYFLEHESQPEKVSDIPTTIWWGVARLTSLKYIDIIPTTGLGKLVDAGLSFLGIIFFAIPSGIFAAGLIEELDHRKHKKQVCKNCGAEVTN